MTLSIVVPTRNRAPLLAQCLRHATRAFPDAEIIVSDNASTDETRAVASDFGVSYAQNPRDIGPYCNFVAAHRLARGDFVVYCADDDFLIAEGVKRVVERMRAEPELVAVHAPWGLVDAAGNIEVAYSLAKPEYASFQLVAANSILPEIAIYRGDFAREMPEPRQHIALPFVHLVAAMKAGKVLFDDQHFYIARTGAAEQNGHNDAMTKWDEWRGGIEYLAAHDSEPDLYSRLVMMAGYMARRMEVAERLNRAVGQVEVADALADRLRFYR